MSQLRFFESFQLEKCPPTDTHDAADSLKVSNQTRDIRALLCPAVYHLLLRVMGNVENLLAIICELYMYYYTGNTNGVCVCVCVRDTQLCL